jgi:hypothetical protein
VGTTWGVVFGVDSSRPLIFLSRTLPVSRSPSRLRPSVFRDGLLARLQPYGLDAAVQGVSVEVPQLEHSAVQQAQASFQVVALGGLPVYQVERKWR